MPTLHNKNIISGNFEQKDFKLQTLSYLNLLFAILEDFFSIMFKSHQVVLLIHNMEKKSVAGSKEIFIFGLRKIHFKKISSFCSNLLF